jgi:SAM-dependent methyltransferase
MMIAQRTLAMGRSLARPLRRNQIMYSARHRLARILLHRYMRRHLRDYFRLVEIGPFPPSDLLLKTSALNQETFEKFVVAFPDDYFASIYATWLDWFQKLESSRFNLRAVGSVFELGCGTARLLRLLRSIEGVRLVGSDTNPDCINWCMRNVPGPEYYVNELSPPLPFLEDAAFDLAYAYSVFTHIPLELQGSWLEEICRILRPGGFFLCTVLGAAHQKLMLTAEDLAQLRAEGHLTFASADQRASLSTQVGGSGWDVFQTRSEVIRAFGAFFQLHDYVPGSNQDLLILQRA